METNSQLIKKVKEGRYNNVYPIAYIDGIIDKESNEKLSDILIRYNNIMVPWQGNITSTRNRVPSPMRRQGIIITYVTDLSEIVTEVYKGTVEDITTNWAEDINWEPVPDLKFVQVNASKLPDGIITPEKLSPALQELISQSGNIVNMPDDEDLEQKDMVLKLKDRPYNSELASGKGYKILRKNWTKVDTETINLLTQDMLTQSNTIYEIRYDFDLNGEEIEIPAGCILKFEGGRLERGTLIGNNTSIIWDSHIFTSIVLKGTFTESLNPIMFGILDSDNINSYKVLYDTHLNASFINSAVEYKGITKIVLSLPDSFTSIPLSEYTDFCNCEIKVESSELNIALFTLINKKEKIDIILDKIQFNSKDFSSISSIPNNPILLITIDDTDWMKRPKHTQVYKRRDIQLLVDKKASNFPICSYDTVESSPVSYYKETSLNKKVFKNLTFIRENLQSLVTLVDIKEQNNVEISGINVVTYNDNNIYADHCFYIENSTNIIFDSISINGTYSKSNAYGYAFELWNAYNVSFNNVFSSSLWHEIGTQSVNKVTITNCDLTTYDSHCYGKDIVLQNCKFRSSAVQTGIGFFGTINISNCECTNSIIFGDWGSSYKAYIENVTLHNQLQGQSSFIFMADQSKETNGSIPEQREDFNWNECPSIIVNGLSIDSIFTTPQVLNIWGYKDSYDIVYTNKPIIELQKLKSLNQIIRLQTGSTRVIFDSKPSLIIKDSIIENNGIIYPYRYDNENIFWQIIFENCNVDFKSIRGTLYRIDTNIIFNKCNVYNFDGIPVIKTENTNITFIDSLLKENIESNGIYHGQYIRCKFLSEKSIDFDNKETPIFEECVSLNTNIPLFSLLPYLDNKFSFRVINKELVRQTKILYYNTEEMQNYYANMLAIAYNYVTDTYYSWNGSNWRKLSEDIITNDNIAWLYNEFFNKSGENTKSLVYQKTDGSIIKEPYTVLTEENRTTLFRNNTSIKHIFAINNTSITLVGLFRGCTNLKSICSFDTSKVFNMQALFDIVSLEKIGTYDMSSINKTISGATTLFNNLMPYLKDVGGFLNLKCSLDLSNLKVLTSESVINILKSISTTPDENSVITFYDGLMENYTELEKNYIQSIKTEVESNGWTVIGL